MGTKDQVAVLLGERRPGFLWRTFTATFDAEMQTATSELATLHGELPRGTLRKILVLHGR